MNVQRIAILRGCLAVAVLFSAAVGVHAAQTQQSPTKELLEYVHDASRLGLTSEQIEANAVKAGWPSAAVKEAMAEVKRTQTSTPAGATPNSPPASAADTAAVAAADPKPSEPPAAAPADDPPLTSHGVPDEYRIGAGDVLQISVWKEPEASVGSTVVRPDGKVSLPLLKEIEVVGMTPTEAEKLITARLTKFIPAVDVTVVVSAINSKKVYMVGAVKKEGPIPYTYRMTVMQAISEAGGLNDYAKRKKIYILRTQNGKDYKLPFDYEAVLKGERMELNIPLLSGDTLVVPH